MRIHSFNNNSGTIDSSAVNIGEGKYLLGEYWPDVSVRHYGARIVFPS